MNLYNVQSLFIFFGILSLVGGGVALFYVRKLDTSARYWLAGALMIGVTNIATIFRAEIPLFWAYSVSIALSCAAYLLMGLGLLHLLGHRRIGPELFWVAVLTLTYTALIEWARRSFPAQVPLVISSLGLGLSSLWCWFPAQAHYQKTRNPFSRHMRWLVLMLGFMQLARIQGAFSAWTLESFGQNTLSLSIWSAIYVLGVLRYCFYIGLRLHDYAQQQAEAAVERARLDEQRKLTTQLAHLERQHSLGVMAASFSHELNQPLTAILNYAELSQLHVKGLKDPPLVLSDINQRIIDNTLRISQVIQRIRHLIRPAVLQAEPVDLGQTLSEVLSLLRTSSLQHEITLVFDRSNSSLWVQADAVHLTQVFLNLVKNAMEASAFATIREVVIALTRQNDQVLVTVKDHGIGLDTEAENQAGQPFYTTKPQGLGMGLSISRQILSQYGGSLTLNNNDNGGVTATVVMPLMTPRFPEA